MKSLTAQLIMGVTIATVVVVGSGCATTKSDDHALVCPQCRNIKVFTSSQELEERVTHSCPGCKGVVKYFWAGQEKVHECSICKKTAFTCPLEHQV